MKSYRILKKLERKFDFDCSKIMVSVEDDIAYLTGKLGIWQQVVDVGHAVAKIRGIRNVVNRITIEGQDYTKDRSDEVAVARSMGKLDEADVVIVGGGVSGCGIARELSQLNLKIVLVEKESDISMGASKANNGMIHPGNAVLPRTLKAKMNIEGNALYDEWARDLGFAFKRDGSIIVAYPGDSKKMLYGAWLLGKLNKVPGMRLISGREVMEKEPNVPPGPVKGLYTPSTAYVDGFEVTIALAENAASNGVKFYLDSEALAIDHSEGKIKGVLTSKGFIETGCVIDAAGVHADEIAAMANEEFYTIHARRGAVIILDKNTEGPSINVTRVRKLYRGSNSKGGGAQRTVSGNPLLGPSAKEIQDKEDSSVEKSEFDYAYNRGIDMFPKAGKKDIISFFSGIRGADYKEDFIIERGRKTPGFIHCSGIQSPGLASAPAIARRVKGLVEEYFSEEGRIIESNPNYNPKRDVPIRFADCSIEEREKLLEKDKTYGNMVCRCEMVTEKEIVDAIHRIPQTTTIDGIKRRTRAGAGRCQGGFCGPKILDIMARELGVDSTDIGLKKDNSPVVESHSIRLHTKEKP